LEGRGVKGRQLTPPPQGGVAAYHIWAGNTPLGRRGEGGDSVQFLL